LIHVIAVITAKGEPDMNGVSQESTNPEAGTPAEEPKPPKKPRVATHRPHLAPSAPKSGKKTTPAKKATKAAHSAKLPKKPSGARQGSKAARVLSMLKRSGGVTMKEIMKATGWQAHSVRGFMSGALGKRMGLAVTSTKVEHRERRYSVKA
jgi:hypothetical protein